MVLVFGLLFLVASVHGSVFRRATGQQHEIELVVVVDYSAFQHWYDQTSTSDTYTVRVNAAKANLQTYLQSLIKTSNVVYKSLESHNVYVQIKLVDILYTVKASESPWTETVKFSSGTEYHVDPNKVFPLFKPYSVSLQSTIPHDHAMILTGYSLDHGDGDTFAGYANTDAECKSRSISIVEDSRGIYTAQLIAHELGHSLGCDHDGDGNSCHGSDGFTMAASFILNNPKKWTFSTCSVNYIRNYIGTLDHGHNDCLLTTQNHHPRTDNPTTKWYGQQYSADEQCQIMYGKGAYLCRDHYHGDYSEVCLKLRCYDPKRDSCRYKDAGDGTPCGDGKWCMSNVCVKDSSAPSVLDACPIGDQIGVVKDGKTCKQILASDPHACSQRDVKAACCDSCTRISMSTTSALSLDQQCEYQYGKGSFFCRTAHRYSGQNVSTLLCGHMYCNDPNRNHYCHSRHADDKTPCGNKAWCQNGVCVHDDRAPSVADDCIFGDQTIGIAAHHLTCEQVKLPGNHYRCYDQYTRTKCCQACKSIRQNVQGCEYGDKISGCHHSSCARHRSDCCQTCNGGLAVGK